MGSADISRLSIYIKQLWRSGASPQFVHVRLRSVLGHVVRENIHLGRSRSRDHRVTGNWELIRISALGSEWGRTRESWAWRTMRLCQGRCAAAPFRHVKFSSFLRRRWMVSLYERTPAAKSVERARKRLRWGRKRHNALGLERK